MYEIVPDHLKVFLEINIPPWDDINPTGLDPYEFSKKLNISDTDLLKFNIINAKREYKKLNRTELKALCQSAKSDNEITGAILSVLAWGGMSHGNPLKLWVSENGICTLIAIIKEMRLLNKTLSVVDAFALFASARKKVKLPGLRISFYSKILFFFYPSACNEEAPILDQFVAKSINVLFSDDPIPMDGDFPKEQSVSAMVMTYEGYLGCVDILRKCFFEKYMVHCSRSQVEYLLFRDCSFSWRSYVKTH